MMFGYKCLQCDTQHKLMWLLQKVAVFTVNIFHILFVDICSAF